MQIGLGAAKFGEQVMHRPAGVPNNCLGRGTVFGEEVSNRFRNSGTYVGNVRSY